MKENIIFNIENPNENEIIRGIRDMEISPRIEEKMAQNLMEMPLIKNNILEKIDLRNLTAPNRNGIKPRKNYEHLKITAKNKDPKDTQFSLVSSQQCNYIGSLINKKMLGKSLPKNFNFILINNGENIDIMNNNRNNSNIKRVLSSNNIVIVDNFNFQRLKNIFNKNNNDIINNNKNNNYYNIDLMKEYRENRFISNNMLKHEITPNNQLIKDNGKNLINENISQSPNRYNKNDVDIRNIKKKQYTNSKSKLRHSNSFNNSSKAIFKNRTTAYKNNEGKNSPFVKSKKVMKNLKNFIDNNVFLVDKTKRSMSPSINILRNTVSQMNQQDVINSFGIYEDNELINNSNDKGMSWRMLENEKNQKNMVKTIEQDKNINKKKYNNNINQYLILKGNASYLVRHCMAHRVNWVPREKTVENMNAFNFKWKELSSGIDYFSLNINPYMKQIVNHYENHYAISNKANMFIHLMKYCEKRNLSVFQYVPFTIVFKIKDKRKIRNTEKQKKWTEKLEQLKKFIQDIDKNVKNYNDIGKYYYDEEYIKDKEKRYEYEKNKLKSLPKDEKYIGKYKVYSDIFPRLKIFEKIQKKWKNDDDQVKDKKDEKLVGHNTLIEIPTTHFKGRNMWVLKAVNLNRGMCIKVVNSFEQMEKVINRFKQGVDYKFSREEMEEEEELNNEGQQSLSEDEATKSESVAQKQNQINDEYEDDKEEKSKNENNKIEENVDNFINIIDENKNEKKEKEKNNEKEDEKENEEKKENEKEKEKESEKGKEKRKEKRKDKGKEKGKNKGKDKGKEDEKEERIYNCSRILIQKYIENPLLYKGRKCDMRIWVLLTHQMKVFLFKEGHLKTCSVEFDINSKNAYTHITNYSFQKHNENFQKFEKGNEVPFYEFQKFIDKQYPEKKYKLKTDLMKQLKKIITLTMRSAKNKINKNKRRFQFEIFGYDFMLDSDFNVFLIEINTNPGLEISSPWIKIIIPRMLDDALRLTVDKLFKPKYDFSKNYKGNYTEEQKKLLVDSKIEVDFNAVNTNNNNNNKEPSMGPSLDKNYTSEKNSIVPNSNNGTKNILNINLDLEGDDKIENVEKNNDIQDNSEDNENQENEENLDNENNIENNEFKFNNDKKEIEEIKSNKNNKEKKDMNKYKKNVKEKNNRNNNTINNKDNKINKNNKLKNEKEKDKEKEKEKDNNNIPYISPFPVPGYSLDENLWDFVCDLRSKDPFEIKDVKEKEKEKKDKDKEKEKKDNTKTVYTGIRHLLKKKEIKNKEGKGNNIKKNNEKKTRINKSVKNNNIGNSPKENYIKKEESKNNINIINKFKVINPILP